LLKFCLLYNYQTTIINCLNQKQQEQIEILKEHLDSYLNEIYSIITDTEDKKIKIFLLLFVFKNYRGDDIFNTPERKKKTKFLTCFDENYKSIFNYLKSIDHSKISNSDKLLKENMEYLLSEIVKNRKERKYVDYLYKIQTLGIIENIPIKH
jgi:hypothetical protein